MIVQEAATGSLEPAATTDVIPEELRQSWMDRYGLKTGIGQAYYVLVHGNESYEKRSGAFVEAIVRASRSEKPEDQEYAERARTDHAEGRIPDKDFMGRPCMRPLYQGEHR